MARNRLIKQSTDVARSFWKDTIVVALILINSVLASVTVVIVALRLRSHDFKVPVQYVVNDRGEVGLASWYTLYSLAAFAIVGLIVATLLSERLHRANPIFARGVLMAQVVVAVLTVLVANALLGLVAQL